MVETFPVVRVCCQPGLPMKESVGSLEINEVWLSCRLPKLLSCTFFGLLTAVSMIVPGFLCVYSNAEIFLNICFAFVFSFFYKGSAFTL